MQESRYIGTCIHVFDLLALSISSLFGSYNSDISHECIKQWFFFFLGGGGGGGGGRKMFSMID